jgi:glycosyltransferase involved in cell wall biosynthesis
MPAQPAISVIIPVYAVGEYLGACLDSILGQAPDGLEVIAVDDASPDDSGRILDARAKEDPRLRVLHLTGNAGPGNARNVGLAEASTSGSSTAMTCWPTERSRPSPPGSARTGPTCC